MGQESIHQSLKLVSSYCLCHFFLLTGRTSQILPSAPSWDPSTESQSHASKPGLPLTWVHRSCQKPASVWSSRAVTVSFGHLPTPPSTSLHCRGTACPAMVIATGCRGLYTRAQSTSCPSLCNDLGVCRVVPLTYLHAPLHLQVCRYFFPFLNTLSQSAATIIVSCAPSLGQQWVCLCAGWNWH